MVNVKKLNGELQEYDPAKLRVSLKRAGADDKHIDNILSDVNKILYDGVTTRKLFKFVFSQLKKCDPKTSCKYDLKNAIMRLGPEGFAFEEYIGYLFKHLGYKTDLNQFARGQFISHEIDVIAEKGNERLMVECKHHKEAWMGTSIQIALYVYARFLDVKKEFSAPVLATNTQFSGQVMKYAKGVGLRLLGWRDPKGSNLALYVEKFKLYPVTMLDTLSKEDLKNLLRNKIILVETLAAKSEAEVVKVLGISRQKAKKVHDQAVALCPSCKLS